VGGGGGYLFHSQSQAEAGPLVAPDVDLVLGIKFLNKVVEQDLVKILAAQVPVPFQGEDLELATLESDHRHLSAWRGPQAKYRGDECLVEQ
jgi:hypothetical protein